MLAALGVRYVIVGHSERRRLFGESDEEAGRKVGAAQAAGLVPILCVGEDETQRLEGHTLGVIERQLQSGLMKMRAPGGDCLVVAYEPVWAIGTGRTATPEQAAEAHGTLREALARLAGAEASARVRILYGGSVTAETAARVFTCPDVDGALVGGASLAADPFARIAASVPR